MARKLYRVSLSLFVRAENELDARLVATDAAEGAMLGAGGDIEGVQVLGVTESTEAELAALSARWEAE